jgi:hypothetical protein
MDAGLARAISQWLDRLRVVLLGGLLALILWMATGAAIAKPLWHDEIYTVLIAKLPSIGAIWAAHRDGVDLQPPLNTFATRIAYQTFGTGPIATRLPPLAGFCLLTLVVASMLRRRVGMTLALAGALIPLQTAAYRYGYEARGYGLMLGCYALAVFAWAEAAQGRRRRLWIPVCAGALATGVWAHYYAAFAFVAIGVAELGRWARARRIDRAMLGGVAAGGLLTLPLLLLVAVAVEQSPRFWARAGEGDVASAYRFLFDSLWWIFVSFPGALVLLALIATAVTGSVWRRRNFDSSLPAPAATVVLPLHEAVALILTGLGPLLMLTAARVSSGAFTPRYGLTAVVAAAIGLPLLVRQLAPRGSLAEVLLLAVLAIPLVRSAAVSATHPRIVADPLAERPLLSQELSRPGPLVGSGSLTYLQLWYYAPPLQRGRLTYLVDPGAALRLTGSDTFDHGYLALARWTPVTVQPYQEFVARHPEFRLYAAGSGWLLTALEEEGAVLELRGVEPGGRVFHVKQ